MSDGITLYCPSCGKLKAIKKEYDELKVKLKMSIKHTEDWYDSSLPVYTCKECKRQFVIERVNKGIFQAKSEDSTRERIVEGEDGKR